jgi:hypothetical protein
MSDRPKRQKVTEVAEEAAESADDDSLTLFEMM